MEETQLLKDVASKYSLSFEAVLCLWDALQRGNGSMAQFSHPELGGSGQWMAGGMLMLQNMFDHSLKAKVDQVCRELAGPAARSANERPQHAPATGGSQQQSQYSGGHAMQSQSSSGWWPSELGRPSSSGSQNQLRYAVFPEARRLAINDGHSVRIYDTAEHRIGGVSQQQGGGESVVFHSDRGRVELSQLREVSVDRPDGGGSREEEAAKSAAARGATPAASGVEAAGVASDARPFLRDAGEAVGRTAGPGASVDPIDALERLAKLHRAGIVTDEEFNAKKAELLRRL